MMKSCLTVFNILVVGIVIICGGCSTGKIREVSSCLPQKSGFEKPAVNPDAASIYDKIIQLQIQLDRVQSEMIKIQSEIVDTTVEIAEIVSGIQVQGMIEVETISLQALEKSRQTLKARIAWWQSMLDTRD